MIRRSGGSPYDRAVEVREVFTDREASNENEYSWDWPRSMMDMGICESVMYRSDKWNPGRFVDYKHLAESEQRVLVVPGFLSPYRGRGLPVMRRATPPALPSFMAELADCIGIQVRVTMQDGEEEYIQIDLGGMKLGGLKHRGKAYLCVYDLSGCKILIQGARLDIQKDGITG